MTAPVETTPLGERVRELRTRQAGLRVTQSVLANALGVSPPLISAWESGKSEPPVERLQDYALAFATARTFAGDQPALVGIGDLSPAEERRRREIFEELERLRNSPVRPADPSSSGTSPLGGRFWYFPDGAPIRIISNPLWPSAESKIPYASRWHPNYIQSFHDADVDSTIALYGHLRAENPTADVDYLTADQASHRDLTGHVVVLGQADHMVSPWIPGHPASEGTPSVVDDLIRRLELPLHARQPAGGDLEFDMEFVVTENADGEPTYFPASGSAPDRLTPYGPQFETDVHGRRVMEGGYPVLRYDAAVLARAPNEYNTSTTVTICAGIFSRGTLGAVRALTDPALKAQNEEFLRTRFAGHKSYWMIFYVPMFRAADGIETVSPDFNRDYNVQRRSVESPGDVEE
jgi:transcriptional regulator with XRE-family HTH domain